MDFDALTALGAELQARLAAVAGTRRFAAKEVIFHAGDIGDAIFLIRSGRVAVRIVTEHGDNMTLALLGPGDSFGELALLAPSGRRSATVPAIEPTEAWTLTRNQLMQSGSDQSVVEALLIDMLARQVRRLTGQLTEALYVPVRHRVARVLLDLCRQQRPIGGRVSLRITQDDLAGLTGATRPTVNQVLRTLEQAGALELRRGRIDVIDREVLVRHRG